MTRYHLGELASTDVRAVIAAAPVAVIPVGSIEQHGPHLPCGTDTYAAELVAAALADQLDALYVPFAPYGVTPLHAGHPGTVNLRRTTFEALLTDVCTELVHMGVRTVLLVNWHEGNIASMDAVATELQAQHEGLVLLGVQACYVAQRIYADDGGELTHGGGIETLAMLAHDPTLVRTDRVGEASRTDDAYAMDEMRRSTEVYGYITDVTTLDPDGWFGTPHWATDARAATFAEDVAQACVPRVARILQLQERRSGIDTDKHGSTRP